MSPWAPLLYLYCTRYVPINSEKCVFADVSATLEAGDPENKVERHKWGSAVKVLRFVLYPLAVGNALSCRGQGVVLGIGFVAQNAPTRKVSPTAVSAVRCTPYIQNVTEDTALLL